MSKLKSFFFKFYVNEYSFIKKNKILQIKFKIRIKTMAKYDDLKSVLYRYYQKKPRKSRKFIYDMFIELGAPKRSLNRWLELLEKNKSIMRKEGSGRRAKIAVKSNITCIKRKFNHKSGCSQRKVAKKLKTSQQWVSSILKKYTNIKCLKKHKKPKMTLAGDDRFYSDNVQNTPYDVKNKLVAKYEDKLLVRIAISQNGISKPLFFKSGLAINQHVYKNQSFTNSLIPFINKYYKKDKYVIFGRIGVFTLCKICPGILK
jgi:hypothetical protein